MTLIFSSGVGSTGLNSMAVPFLFLIPANITLSLLGAQTVPVRLEFGRRKNADFLMSFFVAAPAEALKRNVVPPPFLIGADGTRNNGIIKSLGTVFLSCHTVNHLLVSSIVLPTR